MVGCRDLPETVPWSSSPSVGVPGTPDSRTTFLSRPARGLYSRSGSLSGRGSLKVEAENTSEWALSLGGMRWGGDPGMSHACNTLFIYFEKETEHEQGRGRERGRHRIRSRLQALSAQSLMWLEPQP